MLRTNFPDELEKRRKEAKERQEAFGKLSPQERLALLDGRLGAGLGAVAQRTKLSRMIAKQEVADILDRAASANPDNKPKKSKKA